MTAQRAAIVEEVTAVEQVTDVEYEVPADETPEYSCHYCDRPFRTERQLALHVGTVHAEECTEAELEAFEAEQDDEQYELFTFHLKAAVSVFLLYFMFTFLYALVWAG
ncbi:DUF7410 domain-containing protein [Halosolutus gelatinilyticus]|uniref:DUF7410 domain-containing protein n=1 Tax=Halosolutus gelatinilyticus TaxID=2931975 RepID=UPI001FF2C942|nr:hypothetical protein [Halosolutus gelatinilyticus]